MMRLLFKQPLSRQAAQLSFIPQGHKFRLSRQAAQLSFIPQGYKFRLSRQAAQLSFKTLGPLVIALALAVFPAAPGSARADEVDDSQALKVFRDSPATRGFFDNAYGYAIFPLVGKGGVGVGGSFGKGRVYRRGELTGHVSLVKLSVGFQLGGQAFSELIFFQDQRAYDEFTAGAFELDATASAVAVTAGIQAQAGTTGATAGASTGPETGTQLGAQYSKGLAVFIHAKGGLMYEASVGGQIFNFTPLGTAPN
jgi:hypothetical protein